MQHLESRFPKLKDTDYQVDSPQDKTYNCIAWSVGEKQRSWWPNPHPFANCYWPDEAPEQATMYAFKEAYRSLGYEVCDSEELEEGYQKVAIYADQHGNPKHAARQTEDGKWASKCGDFEDILHELEGLEGDAYGSVSCVMKRPRTEE